MPGRSSSSGKKLSAKELIAERARIDAAMAKLEEAKAQARTQRTEYGRFLQWKVEMQRKERKQRDEEDELMRARVEQKLQAVLQQHREEKLQGRADYRKFIAAPVPKRRPLKIADSYAKEDEIIRQAEEAEQRRREEWESTRLSAIPHSAPAGQGGAGGKRQGSKSPGNLTPPTNASANNHTNNNNNTNEETDATSSAAANHIAAIEVLVRDTRPRQVVNTSAASIARAQELQHELAETERKKKLADQRAHTMEEMYHKARTRRLYAMGRIAADPPADYLIGTDILKYIPVDLIPGASTQGQGLPQQHQHQQIRDDTAFFMTAVGDHERSVPMPAPSDAREVSGMEERHLDASPPGGPGGSSSHHYRTKRYNPDAWMRLPNLDVRVVPPERNREEEQATLEWYKLHMLRYSPTGGKKTVEASKSYRWTRPAEAAELSQGDKARRKSQRFDKM